MTSLRDDIYALLTWTAAMDNDVDRLTDSALCEQSTIHILLKRIGEHLRYPDPPYSFWLGAEG